LTADAGEFKVMPFNLMRPQAFPLVGGAFLLSGASALIYQVAWQRILAFHFEPEAWRARVLAPDVQAYLGESRAQEVLRDYLLSVRPAGEPEVQELNRTSTLGTSSTRAERALAFGQNWRARAKAAPYPEPSAAVGNTSWLPPPR
jgi:hypothetical protein